MVGVAVVVRRRVRLWHIAAPAFAARMHGLLAQKADAATPCHPPAGLGLSPQPRALHPFPA